MTKNLNSLFVDRIRQNQEEIRRWLDSHEESKELPLYSSVDTRNAGFKTAVVDSNLFPAGFNNLCPHGIEDSVKLMRDAINRRVTGCQDILIVAEEHTRNVWYLENIRILQGLIEKAGFNCKIATFLNVQSSFCEKTRYVELETATGEPVRIYCFKKILEGLKSGEEKFCLIILNNDLSTGIPETLKESGIPIYPSIKAGWHSRLKSHHFCHTRDLVNEFAKIVDLDPWHFSCLYSVTDDVNVNVEEDRVLLSDTATDLFKQIEQKYKEHGIEEKPYVVLKSDSGTYGMGVMVIEDPRQIIEFNRRERNKLYKGKSSRVISRYLLQEGVPTIYNVDNVVSEVVIYQIENNLVGGFYRTHTGKSQRENLNAKGMEFKKICPHQGKYGDCGVKYDINIFDVYRILARIAAIAAHREIVQLEAQQK